VGTIFKVDPEDAGNMFHNVSKKKKIKLRIIPYFEEKTTHLRFLHHKDDRKDRRKSADIPLVQYSAAAVIRPHAAENFTQNAGFISDENRRIPLSCTRIIVTFSHCCRLQCIELRSKELFLISRLRFLILWF
jgi:hypothetical protein